MKGTLMEGWVEPVVCVVEAPAMEPVPTARLSRDEVSVMDKLNARFRLDVEWFGSSWAEKLSDIYLAAIRDKGGRG